MASDPTGPLPLPALRERLLTRPTRALVVVPSDGPMTRLPTATRVLREHFGDAERLTMSAAHYPNGSTVRVVVAPLRPMDIAGLDLDLAVVLAPLSARELYEVRARLLRSGGEIVAPLAPREVRDGE